METSKDGKKTSKAKKRIAPEKASDADTPISEDIIEASFENAVDYIVNSTAGSAKGGIPINILQTPMIHLQQDYGFCWDAHQKHSEGAGSTSRTQMGVVKRVLDRQTQLYQVRERFSESDHDSLPSSDLDERSLSDGHQSEEGESSSEQNANVKRDDNNGEIKDDEMEVELGQETEEWGLKNIGDYDLEDEFIDDSEVHHYFENVTKKAKYSGFYIHKGPLKMIEHKPETKAAKKGKGENKPKPTNSQTKNKPAVIEKKKSGQQLTCIEASKSPKNTQVPALSLTQSPVARTD